MFILQADNRCLTSDFRRCAAPSRGWWEAVGSRDPPLSLTHEHRVCFKTPAHWEYAEHWHISAFSETICLHIAFAYQAKERQHYDLFQGNSVCDKMHTTQ